MMVVFAWLQGRGSFTGIELPSGDLESHVMLFGCRGAQWAKTAMQRSTWWISGEECAGLMVGNEVLLGLKTLDCRKLTRVAHWLVATWSHSPKFGGWWPVWPRATCQRCTFGHHLMLLVFDRIIQVTWELEVTSKGGVITHLLIDSTY